MDNYNPNDFNPYENPEHTPNSNRNNPPHWNRQGVRALAPVNYFEIAAWACGVGAIFSSLSVYGPFVLGSLAILFALLSRGGQMTMSKKARQGLILGIAGMILTVIIFVAAWQFALNEYGSIEGVVRAFCEMYGYDFEELYGELFSQYEFLQQ